MDIHKPSPWHKGRRFLKEVGIVVLGVCLALLAQQAVDWLHWQGEVKTARVAIQAEMAKNNLFYARRLAYAPCLERQAAEAERILDDLAAKRPPGHFTTFHPGAHSVLSDSEWQSERAAQSLTHFPRAELAQLGTHYAILPLFRDWLDWEVEAWQTLSVLPHAPENLAPGDLLPLRKALATAQWTERLIALNAGRQLRLGRQLGIADPPPEPGRAAKYCTLDEISWVQWIQSQEPKQ